MLRITAWIPLLVILVIPDLQGGDSKYERESLRGLKGVFVLVEDMLPAVQSAGLTSDAIRVDVESQLRHAGIEVLADQAKRMSTPGMPKIYVNVNVLPLPNRGVWVYDITLTVEQNIYLARNAGRSRSLVAVTWNTSSLSLVPDSNGVSEVRNDISNMVDRFINAYLSVNPKR